VLNKEKNKYKVYVYAISKNEEKFVDRWMNSVNEADAVYVLDTGSTDKTIEKLKKQGAIVKKGNIKPFRFDTARNESLNMVPDDADICLCIDIDEVLEKGWRKKLESIWNPTLTRLRYNYIWSFDKYGNPAVNFYADKIHVKKGYKWVHPVHEVLSYEGNEITVITDEFTIKHYPDSSKSRGSYLPLLEMSVEEDPDDDRNMHYLGREYMYYKRYQECIDTLIKYLEMPNAVWKDERSASMRFIARSYKALNRMRESKMWLELAKKETPYLREPFVESALLEYENGNYQEAIKNIEIALALEKPYKNYINEPFCYDGTVYDILSLSLFNTDRKAEAIYYVKKALDYDPNNERLKNNLEIMKNSVKES